VREEGERGELLRRARTGREKKEWESGVPAVCLGEKLSLGRRSTKVF
jgi:hypothetical protein